MQDRRFEELVRANHRAVSTYAQSMASTPSIAEDAIQETFLRAWRYLDTFRGDGSFEGWLIRICRRCVFDLEARERRSAGPCGSVPLDDDAGAGPSELPDHRSETLVLLGALPPDQREVIVLCGVLGYGYEAAAAVLDIPIGTVRSRLHRARSALSQALGAGGGGRSSSRASA